MAPSYEANGNMTSNDTNTYAPNARGKADPSPTSAQDSAGFGMTEAKAARGAEPVGLASGCGMPGDPPEPRPVASGSPSGRARGAMAVLAVLAALLQGCGIIPSIPRKVKMDDPQVQRLLKAARSFNRTAYGFSPIPQKADVRLELRSTGSYNAMLHIDAGRTSRTIAFRRVNGRYVWIGEQEAFWGPRWYETEDGKIREAIFLTYDAHEVDGSGTPLNKIDVTYWGKETRQLTLGQAEPILKKWGFEVRGRPGASEPATR